MSQSSGRIVGEMKWLVARYPKAPGQLITLGAILADPEEPESCLNRNSVREIEDDEVLDESMAVRRTIQAEESNDNGVILKVAQPLLGAGLSVEGRLRRDRQTVVKALDVKAKVFLPSKEYMDASVESQGVQDYIKASNFSKQLYMIIGVASANKLSIDEETSQERIANIAATVAPPGASFLDVTAEARHEPSSAAISGLRVEEECDFAYRIREFSYWRHRKNKVKMKGDRSEGALFSRDHGFVSESDSSDDEQHETVATFNNLKENDVAMTTSGLVVFEV